MQEDTKSRSQRAEGALSITITVINTAKEIVPVEAAKSVLAGMATLLSVIRDTIKNKDDFEDVARHCEDISAVIRHSCSQPSASKPVIDAIEKLQTTVDRIRDDIKNKSSRAIAKKIFSVSIDKSEITAWKEALLNCRNLFDTHINIDTNHKVNELLNKQTNGPDEPLPQFIPPKPQLFFGRDSFVDQLVKTLLNSQHVALRGPGGIGKTSIAKTLLSDPRIIAHFQTERYFVPFDDLQTASGLSLASFGTVLDRISRTLGIRSTKADLKTVLMWELESRRALIVLDNAETILDAESDIQGFIDELCDMAPHVTLLVTTRNAQLPPNLTRNTVDVPPLDLAAAHQVFTAIHSESTTLNAIEPLLKELDFHPLSITLLAQVARQSKWSLDELNQAWKEENVRVLEQGGAHDAGKNESLAVSIDLTLRSSAFKAIPSALDVLRIVAFLPQGVDNHNLKEFLPGLPNAQIIVGSLSKLSLTYNNGTHITMLAPIRLYILKAHGTSFGNTPFLADVLNFYHSRLMKYAGEYEPKQPPDLAGIREWFIGEDMNVEHVLDTEIVEARQAQDLPKLAECCRYCHSFLVHLLIIAQPRPSSLEDKLLALDYKPKRRFKLTKIVLRLVRYMPHSDRVLDGKAQCLAVAGDVASAIGAVTKACMMYDTAREIARVLGNNLGVMYCLQQKGRAVMLLGRFREAQEVFNDVYRLAKAMKHPVAQAHIELLLSELASFMGEPHAVRMADTARKIVETLPDNTFHLIHAVTSQMYAGYFANDLSAATRHADELLELSSRNSDFQGQIQGHMGLYAIELREGKVEAAVRHLDIAMDLSTTNTDSASLATCLSARASLAADSGDYEAAQTQMARAVQECKGEQRLVEASTIYLHARLQLIAGEYAESRALFESCRGLFDALRDVRFVARIFRALGEIDLLEEKEREAAESFGKALERCSSMGIKPKFLYVCFDCFALPEKFGGWPAFLANNMSDI